MARLTRVGAIVAGVVVAALSGTGVLARAAPAAPPDIPSANIANRAPQAPRSDQLWAPTAATQCATSPSEATSINPFRYVPGSGSSGPWQPNPTMRLLARSFDPDNDAVTTEFVVQSADGASVGRARTGAVPSGRSASVAIADVLATDKPLTAQLRHGEVYRWRARAHDGVTAGTFSSWCYVKVVLAPPGKPSITSPFYRDGELGPQRGWARFTFSSRRATSFEYSVSGGPVRSCSPGTRPTCIFDEGRGTLNLRLSGWGDLLEVRAVDSAGRKSAPGSFAVRTRIKDRSGVYAFDGDLANPAEVPNAAGRWHSSAQTLTSVNGARLARVRGLRVVDVNGGRPNLSPGGIGTCPNREASLCGLRFGGGAPEARASAAPINTDAAFSVAAWAYLDAPSTSKSLLSVTTRPQASGEPIEDVPHVLDVGWDADAGRFYSRVVQADGSTVTAYDNAPIEAAPRAHRWFFLQVVSLGTWVRLDSASLDSPRGCTGNATGARITDCRWQYELHPGKKHLLRSPLPSDGALRVGTGPQGSWRGVVDGLMLWPGLQSNSGLSDDLRANAYRQP